MTRTILVVGSGTGVGKTSFACALVRRLRVLGKNALGLKPVETECTYDEKHDLVAPDGELLHRAAHRSAPPLVVCPYRVALPIAPALAGIVFSLDDLSRAIEGAFEFGDFLVIESTGGALSPIAGDGLSIDLAEKIVAPIVITAIERRGVESDVLAVIEAARRRAIPILGVVLTRLFTDDAALDRLETARMIKERGGVTVYPTIPRFTGDAEAIISSIEEYLASREIAEAILDAAERP